MLAIILGIVFGWKIGALEIVVEVIIGLAIVGGGGGKRFRKALKALIDQLKLPKLAFNK